MEIYNGMISIFVIKLKTTALQKPPAANYTLVLQNIYWPKISLQLQLIAPIFGKIAKVLLAIKIFKVGFLDFTFWGAFSGLSVFPATSLYLIQ